MRAFLAMPPTPASVAQTPHAQTAPTGPAPPPPVPTPENTALIALDADAHAANLRADNGDQRAERARRERFVHAFKVTGFNAVEAARRAGYPNPSTDGPRLLRLPSVRKAARAEVATMASAADFTPEFIVGQLAAIGSADRTQQFDPSTGRIRAPHELPPDLAAAVKRIRKGPFGWEYEFEEKNGALALASKIHGMQKTVSVGHQTIAHRVDLSALRPEEIQELLGLAPPDDGDQDGDVIDADYE